MSVYSSGARKIPVVIATGDVDPEGIQVGLDHCDREVRQKEVPLMRRPRRTIVLVEEVRDGPRGKQIIAFVPQWKPDEAVSFPLELVPAKLRSGLQLDSILLAMVNVDAERGDDLFFDNFEEPPKEARPQ